MIERTCSDFRTVHQAYSASSCKDAYIITSTCNFNYEFLHRKISHIP
jgi:hypothetical protein